MTAFNVHGYILGVASSGLFVAALGLKQNDAAAVFWLAACVCYLSGLAVAALRSS